MAPRKIKKIVGIGLDETIIGTNYSDWIYGRGGGDTLHGRRGDDRLYGENGDDILVGGRGNDRLYGGNGTDCAIFSGNFLDYNFSNPASGGIHVNHVRGTRADGKDYVAGDVECLVFSDLTVDLTTNTDPVGADDGNATDEDTAVAGAPLQDNDFDVEVVLGRQTLTVVAINGQPFVAGVPITLSSGAQLIIAADGSYTYDPSNSTFQNLAEAELAQDSFTYTISDGAGGTDTGNVTLEITGINDAPVITDVVVAGGVTEDDATTLMASGSVTFTETDDTDIISSAVALTSTSTTGPAVPPALLVALATAMTRTQTGINDGTIDWDFALDNSLVQYLAEGETVTATYTLTVEDGSGTGTDTATRDVTMTITGINDAPVITTAPESFDGNGITLSYLFQPQGDGELGAPQFAIVNGTPGAVEFTSVPNGDEPDFMDVDLSGTRITYKIPGANGFTFANVSPNGPLLEDLSNDLPPIIDVTIFSQMGLSNGGSPLTAANIFFTSDTIFVDWGGFTHNEAELVLDVTFADFGFGPVAENQGPGVVVGQVSATDIDTSDVVRYAITGGNASGLFAIDELTGEITTTGALDYETASRYVLTVEARDRATGGLTDSATVHVDVGDVTDTFLFSEDFSDNSAGWSLGPEWQIGSATASTGHVYGFGDPALDLTPTLDNGVAGVILGGNASTALHSSYYLTSPVIDTSVATGGLELKFWRWLNSDYTPYMQNTIDVWDGSTWVNIWATGGSPGIQDAAWTEVAHDISAYANSTMQVRFGFGIGSSGVFTVSSWNIDDVVIA